MTFFCTPHDAGVVKDARFLITTSLSAPEVKKFVPSGWYEVT